MCLLTFANHAGATLLLPTCLISNGKPGCTVHNQDMVYIASSINSYFIQFYKYYSF